MTSQHSPESEASGSDPSDRGPAAAQPDALAGAQPDAQAGEYPGSMRRAGSMRVRVLGSVRFRLAVIVVMVVAVALTVGGALLVKWVEATLVNDLRSRNERILSYLVDSLERGQAPAELFKSTTDLESILDNQTDSPLLGSSDDAREVLSTTYFFIDGPGVTDLKFQVDDQDRVRLFGRPGPTPRLSGHAIDVTRDITTVYGTLTIHAVTPLNGVERSVGALTAALVIGLPLFALLAGILTWFITGRALAPVALMTRRVRELSATNLDARIPVPPTEDEIGHLARTMNDMLDRLQHASVSQRQFVSDASHELRSPVASIRAQLETALQYPDEVDWPTVARIVLAEDARLEHLVGNLLAMARVEEGRLGPRSEIDLDELVMAQTHRMTGVKLDLSAVSAGRVWGNPDELASVIRNLLDNAARHARDRIAVSVVDVGPWVVLKVADDGPGVPLEFRDKIFERFARLQESRERDKGGTGLGLALSKRIVDHHNGEIYVESPGEEGATFVVKLPSSEWTGSVDQVPVMSDAESAGPGREGTGESAVG